MEKLTQIQNKLKVPKNLYNSFGKYYFRNAEAVEEALKPLLQEFNCVLTLSDEIKEIGGIVFVESTATITDGTETISVKSQAGIDPNTKGMHIAQCFGASSSYARKYSLNALFLIDDTRDPDDTNEHDKTPKTDVKPTTVTKTETQVPPSEPSQQEKPKEVKKPLIIVNNEVYKKALNYLADNGLTKWTDIKDKYTIALSDEAQLLKEAGDLIKSKK